MARILVVDDERDVRIAIRRILERSGHEVIEAESGEDATALLETTAVDLVLLDMVMPGQGGAESLGRMRELYTGLRIIAMSAHGLDELPDAQRLGAARAVIKPFTADTLIRIVDEVLADEQPEDDPITDFNIEYLEELDEDLDLEEHTDHLDPPDAK